MNHPEALTAAAAARQIAGGDLAPTELLAACLEQIREREDEVAAWSYIDDAGARATARERDAEARAGRLRGPLHGVPVGVKDVIDVAGMTTTAGAARFAHTEPTEDATCVARLRAAGAVIVGKTTTTELAYFEPSPTRNPCNPAHTPGGSSSGSAAAVGAGMVPVSLGTQTIGSVLRPAAYCGVVGFKGTHGIVPGDGIVPLAALSLDHVGVLARSVEDVGLVFGLLADAPVAPVEPRRRGSPWPASCSSAPSRKSPSAPRRPPSGSATPARRSRDRPARRPSPPSTTPASPCSRASSPPSSPRSTASTPGSTGRGRAA